jgi:hypothetical protein
MKAIRLCQPYSPASITSHSPLHFFVLIQSDFNQNINVLINFASNSPECNFMKSIHPFQTSLDAERHGTDNCEQVLKSCQKNPSREEVRHTVDNFISYAV